MLEFPTLKLELTHMKQSMVVALAQYQDQVSEEVQRQLEYVVENFDYQAVVSQVASEVISSSIQAYFKYGKGRQVIEQAVNEVLGKVFEK